MDNIIKLPAQQALFNSKNRLVDLVLPANSGVYDLSKCYVAIDVAALDLQLDTSQAAQGRLPRTAGYVEAADAVADVRLGLKHNATTVTIYDDCAIPVEALVKNCSMRSSTKGKIEDIRRADTLRATMKAYTDDIEDVEARSITGFGGSQAKTNPWASGRFAIMVGVGETESAYKSHEVRIMLKDIFSIANADAWDTSSYGDLHIHLELNLDRVELKQTLGSTPDVWDRYYHNQQVGTISGPADVKYKTAETVTIANGATSYSSSSILMKAKYQSLEDSPFYNNQMLKVTTTFGGAGTAATPYPTSGDVRWAVVKSISWDKDTKQITLEFGGEVLATGAITVGDVTVDRDVEGVDVTSLANKLSYQSVEMTAVRRADMDSGPSQTQYTQIQTQSDQWQNSSELNRSYFLPAQTTNAFIVLPSKSNTGTPPTAFSDILGCARVGEYRFTINGENVTNRAVPFMPVPGPLVAQADAKNNHGSSLHYTLISEAMMNAGIRYHSLRESVFDQNIPMSIDVPVNGNGEYGWDALADAPKKACYMLALPIPISNEQTQLTIELDGNFPNSSGELHIFSQVRSVV